jgi:hypothetical protein
MPWLDLTDPSSGQIEAAAAAAQALLLVGALVYSHFQVREARDLREATERPFVVVELDVMRIPGISHIVITNFGKSIARNVRFEIEPPLDNARGDPPSSVLTNGIPSLAPGREIVCVHDFLLDRHDKGLAERHEVTVRYEGEPHRSGKPRSYSDSMILDLQQWSEHEYIDRKTIHHVATELEKVRKELHKWSAGMSGGLRVRTDADLAGEAQRRAQARAEALERRERRSGKESGAPPEVHSTDDPASNDPSEFPSAWY